MAVRLSLVGKRRLRCMAALVAVIVVGIASRAAPVGWPPYDKSLGDVLYATAAYLCLALLLPRWPAWLIATIGTAACVAVECLQLSEVNTQLLTIPVLRWFLGTTFSWHDIFCYLLGIAGIFALDLIILRRST
jgi:hypothetical protein